MQRNKDTNTFLLNCDWLQIHCKHNPEIIITGTKRYKFLRAGQTKIFRNVYNVLDVFLNENVAVYCTSANDNIIEENHGILKLQNKQLYIHDCLFEFTKKLLDDLHLEFKSITQLDIAFDFEKFKNGWTGQDLMKKFFNKKIVRKTPNGKDFTFSIGGRGTVNKNVVEVEKVNKRTGEKYLKKEIQTDYGVSVNGFSFGTKKSNVFVRCYNKTIEMKEKQMKPYIQRLHEDIFGLNKDVWRIEFSLKSVRCFMYSRQGQTFFDEDKKYINSLIQAGIVSNIDGSIDFDRVSAILDQQPPDEEGLKKKKLLLKYYDAYLKNVKDGLGFASLSILKIHNLYSIFLGEFKKYFSFRIYDKNCKDISKMKPLKLFKDFDLSFLERKKIILNPLYKNSCRTEKIMIKKLEQLNNSLRNFDEQFNYTAKDLIGKIISIYGLETWAKDREVEYIDNSNYQEDLINCINNN